MTEPAYRTRHASRTGSLTKAVLVGIALIFWAAVPAFAQNTEAFSGGGTAGKSDGYTTYEAADAPYAVTYEDTLYLYGTSTDGKGYYTTYDGQEWSAYSAWDQQPTNFKWQPASVTYGDSQYAYYTSDDNKLYQNAYDGTAWSGWQDTSGAYTYAQAPYANTYADKLYLYGAAEDGNVHGKGFDGTAWPEWTAVNEDYASGAYQPYAIDWNNYQNVFWTGSDGTVYWNRYDGTAWTGATALEGEYTFATSPYAFGYDGDIYAYATTADGLPYYNTFTDGTGWSGWQAYPSAPPVEVAYQANAYVYDDKQHVVYTGNDGHAYYTSYDGAWSESWTDLGENYAYDPIQYEYADTYHHAYTGEDGGIYYKTYADGAADVEPTPTPGY